MRKLLTTSLILLALSLGATGAAPVAHATAADSRNSEIQLGTDKNTTGTVVADPFATAKADANAPATDKAAAGIPTLPVTDGADAFAKPMIWIMTLFAWLVGVAAITLDNVVYYTVVTMGDYVSHLSAVGVTWRILRDIGNIALIFGFLAVGITTILHSEWYGGGKKLLPMMMVAAIFLNFSLFISEAVIDTGNLFATQFYTQINGGKSAGAKDLTTDAITSDGISNKIMSQLGLQTLYNNGSLTAKMKSSNSLIMGFLGIILFLVTAFVMFSLAFILISRFVILLFLIILAPVGFAGYAIPQLSNRAHQWWGKLIEQTITAPILLLLLYIALAVITDASFLTGFGATPDWTGFIPTSGGQSNLLGFASVLLSFLVAMGLLLAVIMVAKRLSAFGADKAINLAGRTTGALSFGAISLAGRVGLGGAGYLLNNKRMQARASQGGGVGFAAKVASFTGRNLEKRTFDIRNIPGVRTGGGLIGGIVGDSSVASVFAGKTTVTAKSGIDATREAYKTYKPFSGDWWRDQQKEYEAAQKELDRKQVLKDALVPTFPPNDESLKAQKELKNLSVDELAKLKGIREGIDTLVHNLSPEKFNELMKSDKLLAGEKKKIREKWAEQFDSPAAAAVTMSRLKTEEISSLDGATLKNTNVVDALGPNELDAIRRKGNLDRNERHEIHSHLMASAAALPVGNPRRVAIEEYFLLDPGGGRKKYWNV